MKNRSFLVVLCILVAVGVLGTLAHLAYAVYAYEHCSIIYFIGKELW